MKKLSILFAMFCLVPSLLFAATIYDNPNEKAKTVETLTAGQSIIPLYYPKSGQWLKVADPKNGNVGWMKISDLNGTLELPNGQNFHQTFRVLPSPHGSVIFREVSYRGFEPINHKRMAELHQQMQQNAIALQMSIGQMMDILMHQQMAMADAFDHFHRPHPLMPVAGFTHAEPLIMLPNHTIVVSKVPAKGKAAAEKPAATPTANNVVTAVKPAMPTANEKTAAPATQAVNEKAITPAKVVSNDTRG